VISLRYRTVACRLSCILVVILVICFWVYPFNVVVLVLVPISVMGSRHVTELVFRLFRSQLIRRLFVIPRHLLGISLTCLLCSAAIILESVWPSIVRVIGGKKSGWRVCSGICVCGSRRDLQLSGARGWKLISTLMKATVHQGAALSQESKAEFSRNTLGGKLTEPSKMPGKRKSRKSLQLVSQSQQIFRGLQFCMSMSSTYGAVLTLLSLCIQQRHCTGSEDEDYQGFGIWSR